MGKITAAEVNKLRKKRKGLEKKLQLKKNNKSWEK